MFSGGAVTISKLRNPQDNDNFGIWAELLQTAVQVGGQIYTAEQQEEIAESKLAFQREQAVMQEETRRMELAIKEKQAELLARASQRDSMLGTVSFTDPKMLAILGGAGLGIGLLVYLLMKK